MEKRFLKKKEKKDSDDKKKMRNKLTNLKS